MAYGTPNSLDEVGDYLTHIRGGRKPSSGDVERLKQRYQRVGGRTPLLDITRSQAGALEKRLRSGERAFKVYFGMKHWHPFIEETIHNIVENGTDLIIGVAMAPQYSRLSIGGYEKTVRTALEATREKIPFLMIKNWHTERSLIRAWSRRVVEGLQRLQSSKAIVLFTAHSLPKKAVSEDDPYLSQLLETCRLVADEAGVSLWRFGFQSASGPREDWLGPHFFDHISDMARSGVKEVLVVPIGFVSDHLEILYDIDIEAREYAGSFGMRLECARSLNNDPDLIEAVASQIERAISMEETVAI